MFTYANNSISADTTTVDLTELGVKTMHEIEAIPMYNLRYKGEHLPRTSLELCGGEFKGDCFAFAQKYLDMYWIQANGYTNKTVDKTRLPSRPCEKDEVTRELWPNDYLFVCGPYKNLTLFGNFNVLPYHTVSFKILPKNDKSEIINFEIQRY
jgi:hypothetical protein